MHAGRHVCAGVVMQKTILHMLDKCVCACALVHNAPNMNCIYESKNQVSLKMIFHFYTCFLTGSDIIIPFSTFISFDIDVNPGQM